MSRKINNTATDQEVLRYYEIQARTKNGNYIENLPIVDWYNGCPRNEVELNMDSFVLWYEEPNKIGFRKQVKKELSALEEECKQIKEKYFSIEEIRKRDKIVKQNEEVEFKIIYDRHKDIIRIPRGPINKIDTLFTSASDLLCRKMPLYWDHHKKMRCVDFYIRHKKKEIRDSKERQELFVSSLSPRQIELFEEMISKEKENVEYELYKMINGWTKKDRMGKSTFNYNPLNSRK